MSIYSSHCSLGNSSNRVSTKTGKVWAIRFHVTGKSDCLMTACQGQIHYTDRVASTGVVAVSSGFAFRAIWGLGSPPGKHPDEYEQQQRKDDRRRKRRLTRCQWQPLTPPGQRKSVARMGICTMPNSCAGATKHHGGKGKQRQGLGSCQRAAD